MAVTTVFLHGDLDERILMDQPKGFESRGKVEKVCLLMKSLYGLKQSPRQWYRKFDTVMLKQGYLRSSYDCCVYFKHILLNISIYLLLYVDDMLIFDEEIQQLKKKLKAEFEMKELGEAKKILGIEITRSKQQRKIYLSQKSYLEKLLSRFGMANAKVVSVPFASHFKLSSEQSPKDEESRKEMENIPYLSVVGSLMYSMVCTRPDLAHAMSVVSRFMTNPGKSTGMQ